MKININVFNKKKLIVSAMVILVIILILFSIGHASILRKNAQVNQEIKNVKVEKVALGSISTELEFASKLDPIQEVTVTPKTEGKVASVNVDIGDKVAAGQVLFTLDATQLKAQLQSQQAAVSTSKANLTNAQNSTRPEQIAQAQASLDSANQSYETTQKNYDRIKTLVAEGAATQQDLDTAKQQLSSDEAQYKNAQEQLNMLNNGPTESSIDVYKAQVAQAESQVNIAQAQLNDASITSPITGVVSAKDVKIGQLASSQSGSVTIIDNSSFLGEISVSDNVVEKIQTGQSVQISINALNNKKITGVIDKISPNSNSKDNSYTVKVKINNSTGDLKAGMFTKISLPSQDKKGILTVPNEALQIENNVNYLYIVERGKVKKVSVNVGISNDKLTEISGNVNVGVDVIVEGQNLLSNGDKVNVVK